MQPPYVLSGLHAAALLAARQTEAASARVSLDLALSDTEVALDGVGVCLPDGQLLTWATIQEVHAQEASCFVLEGGQAIKVQRFSAVTNRACSLIATLGAPTLVVAGFTMHRIVGIEPREDTERKLRVLGTVHGRVLDTCTGLGYTAIAAARTAGEVVTIELDPAVLEVARLNPWSRALFDSPRIRQLVGHGEEVVATFAPASFSAVIHDPPAFSLAGDLYSGAFYRQLFRVLQPGGRLFHYIGQVQSRFSQSLARGVIQRLQEAGFSRVERAPEAFGLLAYR